jgi:hypothetical protein
MYQIGGSRPSELLSSANGGSTSESRQAVMTIPNGVEH